MPLSMANDIIKGVIGVVLRIPPVFVLDQSFKEGLDTSNLPWRNGKLLGSTFVLLLLKILLLTGGCILSVITILLNTDQLITVYTYVTSILCVFYSYWLNTETVTILANRNIGKDSWWYSITETNTILSIILPIFAMQVMLSTLYRWFYKGPFSELLFRVAFFSFVSPTLLCFFPITNSALFNVCMISAALPLAVISAIIFTLTPSIAISIEIAINYCKDHVLGFGIASFIELEWTRIRLPYVLRAFWLLRLMYYFTVYWKDPLTVTVNTILPNMNEVGIVAEMAFRNGSMKDALWIPPEEDLLTGSGEVVHALKWLLVIGCGNCIAILGLTSVISQLCNIIGIVFREILVADDDDRNFATVAAILFFILALQTGITGLEPEKRYVRLCRNFYLLFTAMLHIIHGMLHPVLMSLSASHNSIVHRHARALLVSLFLIVYPLGQLYYLWSHHSLSTWLLAVSAFSVEVVIKVLISLVIYVLFFVDSYKTTFWEELDDYVYYVRGIGSTIEFCFGIFLFFNGAWILVFESGGAIRALMMCIHAYFNIWCEAKSGWVTFIKRRTAVKKINTLPDATAAQLENFSDVCSICYQQMKSAKVTTCKHYFHAVCLRKWLYLQDHCPLCHTVLYRQRVNTALQELRRRYGRNVPPHLVANPNNDLANVNQANNNHHHHPNNVVDNGNQNDDEIDELREDEDDDESIGNSVILTSDTDLDN